MTGAVAVAGARARSVARVRSWPWWVQVLAVYALARLTSAAILLAVARAQVANLWTPAAPSYLQFTGLMWDSSWYQAIAEHGYPAQLPVGSDGLVQQNVWAFFPLFPVLVRAVSTVTGAPFFVAGPVFATALGAAAMLVIHRLVAAGAPRAVAARPGLPLAAVTLVACFPTAVVLQIAYTESLALLLVAAAILQLVRRRYVAVMVLVLALGFTRAVALPMAFVVGVHAVARWRAARRGQDQLGRRDVVGLVGVLAVCAVAGVAWPAVVGAVTGTPDGFLQTQAAWRSRPDVVLFLPWLDIARWLVGGWAPVLLVALVAAAVALLACPPARRLGPELLAWPVGYLGYLAAVVEPGTSVARFLLLAFPFAPIVAALVPGPVRRRRIWLGALVLVMTLLQVAWVWQLWRLTPPSGWPP